jgi:CBS domain-containing protein
MRKPIAGGRKRARVAMKSKTIRRAGRSRRRPVDLHFRNYLLEPHPEFGFENCRDRVRGIGSNGTTATKCATGTQAFVAHERRTNMRVKDVMMGTPASCNTGTNLGAAVEILWNRNCGILPVVDSEEHVQGVVTDRDLCIALGTRNRLPGEITVGEVISGKIFTCKPEDEIRTALATMAKEQVRRLPVVNAEGKLEGILSMDDVTLHAEAGRLDKRIDLSYEEVAKTLKHVYAPRLPQLVQ